MLLLLLRLGSKVELLLNATLEKVSLLVKFDGRLTVRV